MKLSLSFEDTSGRCKLLVACVLQIMVSNPSVHNPYQHMGSFLGFYKSDWMTPGCSVM